MHIAASALIKLICQSLHSLFYVLFYIMSCIAVKKPITCCDVLCKLSMYKSENKTCTLMKPVSVMHYMLYGTCVSNYLFFVLKLIFVWAMNKILNALISIYPVCCTAGKMCYKNFFYIYMLFITKLWFHLASYWILFLLHMYFYILIKFMLK